jgi:transcription antitermination factor NusG
MRLMIGFRFPNLSCSHGWAFDKKAPRSVPKNTEVFLTLMEIEPIQRAPDEVFHSRWWAAQVQTQDEQRVVNAVNSVGGHALVPMEHVKKTYDRKNKKMVTIEWDRPIFPGYIFYTGERDMIFEARKVIRVFATDERGSNQIRNFVKAYEAGPVRRAQEFPLTEGLKVKIVSGPYAYCEGIVEKFGDEKVFLKVHSIGWSELETDRSNIEPFVGD